MGGRGKRKTSETQLTNTPSLKTQHPPQFNINHKHSCFEGDRLVSFLHSFQKVIDSETQSNQVLPEKLWYKRQFAVGVNEVTRILERMNSSTDAAIPTPLQAVLLASDCNPRWLTKHLPSLASSRNVPLIYVKDRKEGSLRLGELIKVKTALAIGVKEKGSNINRYIQRVVGHEDLDA